MSLHMSKVHFFLSLSNIPLYEIPELTTVNHSSADGHLFPMTTTNKAGMNIHLQVFVWTYAFLFLLGK